jgi:MbtH protein
MEGEEKEDRIYEKEDREYKVVVNAQNEHSIWPADRENMEGWTDVGKSGTREECQAHVNEAWADWTPS